MALFPNLNTKFFYDIDFCGQSYQRSTIVIYNSRAVPNIGNLLISMTLGKVVIYDCNVLS